MEPTLELAALSEILARNFKSIRDEFKNIFEGGLDTYLHSQTEKFYFTNTFLHRSEKVVFSDIYYPVKATYKELTTDFSDLNTIFENYKNLTIVGSAGSGKTTLVKYIFLNCLQKTFKIPVLLELRHLNSFGGTFEDLLTGKILSQDIKPNGDILHKSLKKGIFLFLLDGYDEIFSERKDDLNRQIENFIDTYSKNNFLITTRPGSGIESFPRFYDFFVDDLDDDDVKGFLDKIVRSDERKSRIYQIIDDPKQRAYMNYLRNPLLLSMFILAFESHPEIPSRKSSFYRNVFDTLYSKHDGITKNSFPREKLTGFEREDFERILNIFSYHSYVNGIYTFTHEYLVDILAKVVKSLNLNCSIDDLIYDLRTTISILVLDGFEYHFPHRSMQEYFTAQFLSLLSSDKKSKAYSAIYEAHKNSEDYSFYLWDLCGELDKKGFTLFLLIPALKDYLNKLKGRKDENLLNNYLKILDGGIIKTKDGILIYRMGNFYAELNLYVNAYDYLEFANFIEMKCKTEFLDYCKANHRTENLNRIGEVNIDTNVKEILLKNGIGAVIRSNKLKLNNVIKSLEKKMANEDKIIDQFLDF